MANRIVHFLVDSSSWANPKIKYRRHRIADYIYKQADTEDIVWIYPGSSTIRKPHSYINAKRLIQKNPQTNVKGIKEWVLPDYIPARYMKFKSSFGSLHFRKLKKYIKSYNEKKVLWFTYPAYPYIINMYNWDVVVYDCTDLWIEPSGGSRSNTFSSKFAARLINSAEKMIINKSKIVFTSSKFLAERVKDISGRRAIIIENGVDLFFFNKNSKIANKVLENVPKPRLGYVGAMRSKIDFNLLKELANRNPDWSIVLIGPDCLNTRDVFERLVQLDNVFWTGEVDPKIIPDYIKALDVGLLPYRDLEYNKAVFPIKFYEYLSQGIPVVGCGLPSTKKYCENGIYLHVEKDCFLQACGEVLSWPTGEHEFCVSRRIELAQEASWENKFNYMLEKIRDYV